jgi:hypothetical protein
VCFVASTGAVVDVPSDATATSGSPAEQRAANSTNVVFDRFMNVLCLDYSLYGGIFVRSPSFIAD